MKINPCFFFSVPGFVGLLHLITNEKKYWYYGKHKKKVKMKKCSRRSLLSLGTYIAEIACCHSSEIMLRSGRRCLNIVVVRKFFSNPNPGDSSEQGWERIRETFDAVAPRVILGLGVIGTATVMLRNYNPTKDNALSLVDDIKRQLSPSDIQHSSTTSIKLAMLDKKGTKESCNTLEA